MPLVAFDARDAHRAMPHGSGIYVRRLLEALQRQAHPGHELWSIERGGRGPEVCWEQWSLPRLLRARGADLVHSPDSFLPLRRPCPGVLTVYDLAFEAIPDDIPGATGLKYRTLLPRGARSAERVICPSHFTAEDLHARYGIPTERIRVIPGAPALPPGTLEPPAGPYLLAVGDLRPKKNLPVLLAAYRVLRQREGIPHRLILAGADVGQGATLRELAGDEPVVLPGYIGDAQLDALIRGATALVLPSLYEGFGLVVLEAMARGCPAVLARAGALPETGGDAAVYFDPHDAQDLAAVLAGIISNQAERERLTDVGRARAEEFSWENTAAATTAVYSELLA